MAMQKLSSDIQSLFTASTQICSYKRAIEELVYNSLDAESTSIAIRINIEQSSIQVIDNGCGISKGNFCLVGHRHATSKCVDMSTLKSVPNTYGYRGQSLASIIEVSKNVKITSRCQNTEDTWEKSFHKGKEQNLTHTSKRPSKGTTVDIKGFLYNLKIQKNAVDSLTELNDIKSFLEQLSLAHNNISVSLRDDTKNEIIFKLHKNRDIYQTLTSLFGVERKDVQELKVEKNLYKVTAYIGKEDKEVCQKHWVYLNSRILQNSKVQKIVNDNLKRVLKLNLQSTRKVKSKNSFNQEDNLSKKGIPFYFIFFTCPYNDYDITYAPKKTEVEFKNWEHTNKLVEKIVKFYAGDVHLKPVKNQVKNQHKPEETRDQVKKIMDKILGSNPKRIGVSQMQNGIKGKVTKRKPKNKADKITLPKVLPDDNINKNNKKEIGNENSKTMNNLQLLPKKVLHYSGSGNQKVIEIPSEMKQNITNTMVRSPKDLPATKNNKANKNNKQRTEIITNLIQDNFSQEKNTHQDKIIRKRRKSHETREEIQKLKAANHKTGKLKLDRKNLRKTTVSPKKYQKSNMIVKNDRKGKAVHRSLKNPLIKIFKEPTGSVKRRCKLLANKVNNLISFKKKRKRKIFINETVHYSNIIKDNKNYSVRKKIGEIVIHEYIPKPTGLSHPTFNGCMRDNQTTTSHKSSYDLVQTILRTQETRNSYINEVTDVNIATNHESQEPDDDDSDGTRYMFAKCNNIQVENTNTSIPLLPRLTFQSHNYVETWNRLSHNYNNENDDPKNPNQKPAKVRFITTRSRDDFVIPISRPEPKKINSKIKHVEFQSTKIDQFTKKDDSEKETSYTIEFSKTRDNYILDGNVVLPKSSTPYFLNENEAVTDFQDVTFTNVHGNDFDIENSQNCLTYTIDHHSKVTGNKRDEEARYFEGEETVDYIENSTERLPYRDDDWKSMIIENENFNQTSEPRDDINVIFISKSQEQVANNFDPLSICETVHSQEFEEHETNHGKWNDSLFNGELDIDSFLCDRNAYTQSNIYESFKEAYHNFNTENRNSPERENSDRIEEIKEKDRSDTARKVLKDVYKKCDQTLDRILRDKPAKIENADVQDRNNFTFKNRLRFVPKGMSQIFAKGQTKLNVCDYNLEEDCYEKEMYNNFAENVKINCEIFEPVVQNVKEITTKAIEKVKNKVDKDTAALVFNGNALKQAKCYRQIDNKFIAAKIEGRSNQTMCLVTECLVLFDQHAVHERIRLENNLSDYFNGTEWKSIPLDNITLKLTEDEILYLHNCKDKFSQLGLQWVILSNGEVSINAIPEAILGKNPRQVETVIKAVKNLIIEEINAIKTQSGCISLYPKSIMDLVFSEACRYAIKFGDPLSKKECEDLLNSLSECKVPFQCAHGRPVMAVLLDIKKDLKKYQINLRSVQKWLKVKKQVQKK